MKKAILYIILFVAIQLLVGFGGEVVRRLFFPDMAADDVNLLIIVTGISNALILALFLLLRWCPVSRSYVRSRPWWVLAWTVVLAFGIIIPATWLQELLPESWTQDLLAEQLPKMLKTQQGYFVICLLAPLTEEVVFRGAIIRALLEWGRRFGANAEWIAIILSAVFFAAIHFNPSQIPYAMLVGILLGWLFVRTGSIVPGVILHWINNSAAYVLLNMFPTMPADAKLVEYFGGNQMALYQALGCSLLLVLPALYQLHIRTK